MLKQIYSMTLPAANRSHLLVDQSERSYHQTQAQTPPVLPKEIASLVKLRNYESAIVRFFGWWHWLGSSKFPWFLYLGSTAMCHDRSSVSRQVFFSRTWHCEIMLKVLIACVASVRGPTWWSSRLEVWMFLERFQWLSISSGIRFEHSVLEVWVIWWEGVTWIHL